MTKASTVKEAPVVNLNIIAEPIIVTQEDLNNWYTLNEQLAQIKEQEMELRKKIFGSYFPTPVEGTNIAELSAGYIIKGKRVISRTVDAENLVTMRPMLTQEGIAVDSLIKYKPELILPAYRALSEEQRLKFDNVLTIKDVSPALEIMKPKRG
jgi:hypothetical protein